MKTKQYCVVEYTDCDMSVKTFDYTEKSVVEIEKYVHEEASRRGISEDIDFDFGCPECIAHVVSKGDWNIKVMLSN